MLIRNFRAEGELDTSTRPYILVLGQLCIIAAIVLRRRAREIGGVGPPSAVSLGDLCGGLD